MVSKRDALSIKHIFKKCKPTLIIGVCLIGAGVVLSLCAVFTHLHSESKKASLVAQSVEDGTKAEFEVVTGNQKTKKITDAIPVIRIPSVNLEAPILEGTGMSQLEVGAGHFTGSCDMGEKGNYCLAGHSSSRYACVFNSLNDVNFGDEIRLSDGKGSEYIYYVTQMFVVDPEDVYVLDATPEARVTLITCTDNATRRLCVIGERISDEELALLRESNTLMEINAIKQLNRDYARLDFSYLVGGVG